MRQVPVIVNRTCCWITAGSLMDFLTTGISLSVAKPHSLETRSVDVSLVSSVDQTYIPATDLHQPNQMSDSV